MAEKILNTRLQMRYDSYANWSDKNPVLKAGELAIATVAKNDTNAAATGHANLPNIVMKVGDGVSHYNDLKFISALAADVHEWAKAASAPTYSYDQIEGLEQYIRDTANNEIENTDTQYNIVAVEGSKYKFELKSKGLSDAAWAHVAYIDLSEIDTRLGNLADLVGTEKVSKQIGDAIGALNADEVKAGQGEIIESVKEEAGVVTVTKRALVKEDIPVIEQNQVNGLDTALQNAAKAGTDAADQALADAKEYSDGKLEAAVEALYYGDDDYVAGQFVTKVTEENGVIAVERAQITIDNVKDLTQTLADMNNEIDGKQDQLTFTSAPNASDNRVATEQYVLEAVSDLEGAMHFIGVLDALPEEIGDHVAGNVIMIPDAEDPNVMIEYVLDKQGKWQKLGHESIYEMKADAKTKHEAIEKAIADGLDALDQAKQDNVNFKSAYSAENPVMTEDDVDGAIATAVEGLKYEDTAVAKKFVTAVTQENGVIEVAREELKATDIPMIEQSQVNGLEDDIAAAAKAGTDAAAQALEDAQDYADDKLEEAMLALKAEDEAVEDNVVTAVAQENGVISVTRAPLSRLAWTGNVNDLQQSEGDVLVFYCGTASDVF